MWLLYDCRGKITHLEIFNLKDYAAGQAVSNAEINTLQLAINQGNVVKLKRVIWRIIRDFTGSAENTAESKDIRDKLIRILYNIPELQSFYKNSPLKSRIGSDSTGTSRHRFGMGLVMKETLPRRSWKKLEKVQKKSPWRIPVCLTALQRVTYLPKGEQNFPWDYRRVAWVFNSTVHRVCRAATLLPYLNWEYERRREWVIHSSSILVEPNGNMATLGWMQTEVDNGLSLEKMYGIWLSYNSTDYFRYTKNVAVGLKALGLQRGENIGIITDNHPEWLFHRNRSSGIGSDHGQSVYVLHC